MGENRHDRAAPVEAFIARWQGREGGQERANYAMFLAELCSAPDISPPDPAGDKETNDYVFERVVQETQRDGAVSSKRIDLYKRDCFVLDEILARLVALNKERAEEEARGFVRWLRPEYQIPRLGTPKERAELELVGGAVSAPSAAPRSRAAFPADDFGQTVAVMAALAFASAPLDADAIAAMFKQGRKIAPKVAAVLAALSRTAEVTTADGGVTFALRSAA